MNIIKSLYECMLDILIFLRPILTNLLYHNYSFQYVGIFFETNYKIYLTNTKQDFRRCNNINDLKTCV